jgi:hypothetical protein
MRRSTAEVAGRHSAGLVAVLALVLLGPVASPAQVPPGSPAPGQPLLPPSLPPTLPGGVALPNLPAGTQQEILQRILDAAGGRALPPPSPSLAPAMVPAPASAPMMPAAPSTARTDPGEPFSNTESFFAARLPDQQPPLRQFGYDTFRRSSGATG